MRPAFKWTGITVAFLAIAIGVLAAFFDWNWLKGPIASVTSKALERRLAIQGDLAVQLSLTPRITAHKIELANTPWGSESKMLELDRLEFSIGLKDLLKRRVVLPEIRLTAPQLLLEKNSAGQANWTFGGGQARKSAQPAIPIQIGLLTIDNGRLVYNDQQTDTAVDLTLSTPPNSTGQQVLHVDGQGRFKGARFTVEAEGGSLLSLREKTEPYPFEIKVLAGETKATVQGKLADPLQFGGPDLTITAQGPDLSGLYSVIGVALPRTPPYKLTGHLTREGERWVVRDFKGSVGNSDLSGDLAYVRRNERPYLQANLASHKLDFKDLAGFLGAETTPEQPVRPRMLPDKPYDLAALRAGDADVEFRGDNIITPNLPVDEFAAHLQLDHGKVTLNPLNFRIDIGQIASNIDLDARADKIATKADVQIRKIPLQRLLAGTQFAEQSAGTFFGRAKLTTTGNSIADMLGYADGDVTLIMESGRISKLLVDLIGLDMARSLFLELTKDQSASIRCVVANLPMTQGLMKTQPLVVDTTASNIVGEGEINLRTEGLDLRLTAHPKQPSVLSARAPLIIKGTFKDPSVYPDPKWLAARGAASVVLGAFLTPVAAIIPWIELGLGEDSQCRALIDAAKGQAAAPPPKR